MSGTDIAYRAGKSGGKRTRLVKRILAGRYEGLNDVQLRTLLQRELGDEFPYGFPYYCPTRCYAARFVRGATFLRAMS
eukprot:2270438-Rhodomonas_salina.4